MKKKSLDRLSMRERQIMDEVYRLGEATAAEVRKAISDPPSYSAVRALLAILEDKGMLMHFKRGRAYVYRPTIGHHQVRTQALKRLIHTFFDGSVAGVVAALVKLPGGKLSEEDIERLEKMVGDTRKRKRRK